MGSRPATMPVVSPWMPHSPHDKLYQLAALNTKGMTEVKHQLNIGQTLESGLRSPLRCTDVVGLVGSAQSLWLPSGSKKHKGFQTPFPRKCFCKFEMRSLVTWVAGVVHANTCFLEHRRLWDQMMAIMSLDLPFLFIGDLFPRGGNPRREVNWVSWNLIRKFMSKNKFKC